MNPRASGKTQGDSPVTDMLVFGLGGGDRVVVRPSGTEPKLKVYIEAVEDVRDGDLAVARRCAHDRRHGIAEAMRPMVVAQLS